MTTRSPHKRLRVIRTDGREEFLLRPAFDQALSEVGLPPWLRREILASEKTRSLVLAELRQAHLTSL